MVELDGRADHTTTLDRDRDLARDLAVVRSGRVTIRLGWGQVFDRPCDTPHDLAQLLRARGWTGAAGACHRCGT